MCKKLKLTHLIFADDLMVGNINSVSRVMEALTHFNDVTDLQANMDKSNLFLAGVDDQTKDQLVRKIGFVLGTLPIRYLGLPLSTFKRWNKMKCQQLIDKITSKISSAYSKQLSYTGRLQIINVVLFSIHSF